MPDGRSDGNGTGRHGCHVDPGVARDGSRAGGARESRQSRGAWSASCWATSRERLAPIGRLEDLKAVADEAIAYFDSLDEKGLTPKALAGRSQALRQIGEVRRAQGHLDKAMDAFRRSFADAERLLTGASLDSEANFLLAQSTFWIGHVHMEQGDLDRATERFTIIWLSPKRWSSGTRMTTYGCSSWPTPHSSLGTIYKIRGDTAAALENFRGDQAIVKTLVERNPDDLDLLLELAESTSWIGTALETLGDLEGALVAIRR